MKHCLIPPYRNRNTLTGPTLSTMAFNRPTRSLPASNFIRRHAAYNKNLHGTLYFFADRLALRLNRTHRPFVMKYIIPSTKNMVKTQSLYVVGRKVLIVGQLVDWDIRNKMAVMLVGGVSVTSGHQNPKTSPKGASGPVTPGGRGRKLHQSHQWSKESAVPPTPTPTPTPLGSSISPSLNPSVKGKGKAVLEPEAEEYVKEEVDDNDEEDEMPVLKKQGRPRKEILKDAAKRLKNP
ncbi:hypothetical protein PtB15_13B345 [Puccinia triticina]|nr:hypothetical protein PtB15_13B345 [Puccinia triticina]